MFSEKRMDASFRKRLKRQLYYGDIGNLDNPSLPLTELSVEYFKDSVAQKLGHVDLDMASDVIKRNKVSPCSMVVSLLYAKRLRQRNKDYLGSISSSDVFFISMMMASKYLYDEGVEEEVFNDEWAEGSDQEVEDVNQMEMDFLQAMDWRLFVRPDEFDAALTEIERRLALQEGLKRGWFTYSELAVLMDMNLISSLWTNVGIECSKLTLALSAAYLGSLISLLGSTAIAAQVAGPVSSAMVTIISSQLSPLGISNWQSLPPCIPFALSTGDITGDIRPDTTLDMIFNQDRTAKRNETADGKKEEEVSSGNFPEVRAPGCLTWAPDDPVCVDANCEKGKDDSEVLTDISKSPSSQKTKSSLLSIWFLDSLLSQLWSVTSGKQKKSEQQNHSQWVDTDNNEDREKMPSCRQCCFGSTRVRHRICSHHPSSQELKLETDEIHMGNQHNHDTIFGENHGSFYEAANYEPHHPVPVLRGCQKDATTKSLSLSTCNCGRSGLQNSPLDLVANQNGMITDFCCSRKCLRQDLKQSDSEQEKPHKMVSNLLATSQWLYPSKRSSHMVDNDFSNVPLSPSLITETTFFQVPIGFRTGLSPVIEVT